MSTNEKGTLDTIRALLNEEDSSSVQNSNTSGKASGNTREDPESVDAEMEQQQDGVDGSDADAKDRQQKSVSSAPSDMGEEKGEGDEEEMSGDDDQMDEEYDKKHDKIKNEEADEEGDEEDDDDEDDEEDEAVRQKSEMNRKKMKEAVDQLFGDLGDDVIDDAFKNRAVAMVEAAVADRVEIIKEDLKAQRDEQIEVKTTELEEEFENKYNQLVEAVDTHMDYVAEKWLTENTVAVEQNLRTEISEQFIDKLRGVFAESYIDIPDERYNVLEDLNSTIEQLQEQLNESETEKARMHKVLIESKRSAIFNELAEDFTDTQRERLRKLTEGVEFNGEENYKDSIKSVINGFLSESSDTSDNDTEEGVTLNEAIKEQDESNNETPNFAPDEDTRRLVEGATRFAPRKN